MTQKNCNQCKTQFEITDADRAVYKQWEVPEPALCSMCRQKARIIFRNFKTLYSRTSDKSGKPLISAYAPDALCVVWDTDEWWADDWDDLAHGRDIDFTKPFFPQIGELMKMQPRFSIMNVNSENCKFSNMTVRSKNCYMVFGCVDDEDCYYGHIVWDSVDCMDALYAYKCQLCYECIDTVNCYNCTWCQECENCNYSMACFECTNCENCIGCVGLRDKQYHIFNKPVSKEEYLAFSKNLNWCDPKAVVDIFKKRDELKKQIPRRAFHGSRAEDVSGEHLYNCKDVHDAFDVKDSENCKHLYTAKNFKDAYDISFTVYGELQYNSLTCGGKGSGYSIIGSHSCFNCSFTSYADQCFSSNNIFGCVGLKKKEYCILNKQYSKADYLTLVEKLKKHMQKTGEWGLFFPRELSPFAYNESIINEYHPLKREEALALGYRWRDSIPRTRGKETIDAGALPHDISKVPDTITHEILSCEECGNNYKVITQEVNFLKRQELPLPRACFDCRHSRRMRSRDKRILEKRACSVCDVAVNTTYRETEQPLMCESCYWKRV